MIPHLKRLIMVRMKDAFKQMGKWIKSLGATALPGITGAIGSFLLKTIASAVGLV